MSLTIYTCQRFTCFHLPQLPEDMIVRNGSIGHALGYPLGHCLAVRGRHQRHPT